jgi:hypothetical protein
MAFPPLHRVRLTPSFSDLFFCVLIFWLFVADPSGWSRLLWDGDVALHTRIGDFVLDNGHVPLRDPWSFTMPGERWIAFQWGTGVLFAALNRAWGLKGIVLLCGAIIALYHTVLLREMVRRGAHGLIAVLLVMAGCNAAMIHYHARPHLLSLLWLTLAGCVIARDREAPSARIWWLVPLMLIWVNTHSGFPVLIAVLALLAIGSALEAAPGGRYATARRYGFVTLACAAATLVNPNTYHLHAHIRQFLNNPWIMEHVSEFQSPQFRSEPAYYFLVLLFLAMAMVSQFLRRRQWTEALWTVVFGMMCFVSARHIPLFLVLVLPGVAIELSRLWRDWVSRQPRVSVAHPLDEVGGKLGAGLRPVGLAALAGLIAIVLLSDSRRWPTDLSDKYFPRQAIRSNAPELAQGRLFTTDQWADYLLWVNYPRQRVFMDGRSDFFQERVGNDYLAILEGRPGWRRLLDRWGIDRILVPPGAHLVERLSSDASWQTRYSDKEAVLLVRAATTSAGLDSPGLASE